MNFLNSPVTPATIQQVEIQLKLCADLSAKFMHGVEQLCVLNIHTTKAFLQEANLTTRQFVAARQPQAMLAIATSQSQPTARNAVEYASEVIRIVTDTQAALALVSERRIAEVTRRSHELINDLAVPPVPLEKVMALILHAFATSHIDWQQQLHSRGQTVPSKDPLVIDLDRESVTEIAEDFGYQSAAPSLEPIDMN